jgi:hypothetical protein
MTIITTSVVSSQKNKAFVGLRSCGLQADVDAMKERRSESSLQEME